MKYTLRAGQLSESDSGLPLARLRGFLPGQSKQICAEGGQTLLKTEVRLLDVPGLRPGDVRAREYVMLTDSGETVATARPCYSGDELPEEKGWPANRLPKVDHAALYFGGGGHRLVMHSSLCYELLSADGSRELSINHRGLKGGWEIEAGSEVSAAFVLGLFIFCRYMERENGSVSV